MNFQVPDQVGDPITAWRIWFVVPQNKTSGELRLQSIVYGKLWEPKQVEEAKCHGIMAPTDHAAPEEGHSCGIYAVKSREAVDRYYRDPTYHVREGWLNIWRVVGQVAMWGKIVEGEKGYRAQYAYPIKLEIPRIVKGREQHLTAREVQIALEHYCETEIIEDTVREI